MGDNNGKDERETRMGHKKHYLGPKMEHTSETRELETRAGDNNGNRKQQWDTRAAINHGEQE